MTRIRSHPVAKLLRSHSGNDIQWVRPREPAGLKIHGLAAAGDSARDGHSSSLTTLTPRPAGGLRRTDSEFTVTGFFKF
jgi:hypothetical protein